MAQLRNVVQQRVISKVQMGTVLRKFKLILVCEEKSLVSCCILVFVVALQKLFVGVFDTTNTTITAGTSLFLNCFIC